ncbi:MAG: Epimerase family protein [Verrucomicrobiales bacterium]|nr:Epimerase family protein [Verrucomicrobiales bacterium]
MKIVIPGGTGQIGCLLARAMVRDGHEVIVLSRKPELRQEWQVLPWDAVTVGKSLKIMEGADVVINLVGRTVNCRLTPRHRHEIIESRVKSTRAIGEAIKGLNSPPRVWLQASTATIYAHRYDAPNDEFTGKLGGAEEGAPETWDFSVKVATEWEAAMSESGDLPGTRKVLLRSAITMSPDAGGVFEVMLGLVRKGLGGRVGNGKQFVSWIHSDDFVKAVYWLIEHQEIEGAVNVCAPGPLPNAEFMKAFREAWGIGFGLPAENWMVEVGTFFLRTESELVLKSRRVVPGVLQKNGFEFKYPAWPQAVKQLCGQWRELHKV